MIPCNELRIGNQVLVDETLRKVSSISGTTVSTIGSGNSPEAATERSINNIQPVPLTDDVLRQCGFVYHDYFKFWQLLTSTAGLRSEMDIDRDYDIIDFMRRPLIRKVASLHQLQNIYFMLKGTELNFTEKQVPVMAGRN
ncbi:MAG TPA: hypothetical protein VGB56_06895 [Flavisolibacter sp.]